ncbi:MAG TPA: ankyrin repeat domain-containing protein [Sulfurimonas autotrophica]|nr:ankyrin repeat domain-containing protein [Sulfurimonas autotrophica]
MKLYTLILAISIFTNTVYAKEAYNITLNQEEYTFLICHLSTDMPSSDLQYTLHTEYISKTNKYYLKLGGDKYFLSNLQKNLLTYRKNASNSRKISRYNVYKNLKYRNNIKLVIESNNNINIKKTISKLEHVNFQDKNSYTPIYYAISSKNLSTLELLINKGANVNTYTIDNITPLHHAIKYGNLEMIKYLIEQGALINPQDSLGKTPLHIASEKNNKEVINYLISKGANKNIQDYSGLLPRF